MKDNMSKILSAIPKDITVVAATKSRSIPEIQQAISSGIKIIGENYVQEAEEKYPLLKEKVSFHFIGHLQGNKVQKAVEIFDMIQSVDSLKIAKEIDKRTKKHLPVLVEINIGREKLKTGIFPEQASELITSISALKNLKVKGLMTLAPVMKLPEEYREYFREMKLLFEKIKSAGIKNISMEILSMGMSNNYKIAIEEGSNMLRLGRVLFE